MSIPDYQTAMLPLLKLVAQHGEISIRDAIKFLALEFKLTGAEQRELLPSGKQAIFQNRIAWARTYLKKAGFLASQRRGMMEITARGKQVLVT